MHDTVATGLVDHRYHHVQIGTFAIRCHRAYFSRPTKDSVFNRKFNS